jgi:hypothetical protein
MYNRQELINAVEQQIKDVCLMYFADEEITSVDIRLQLIDGSYNVLFGDSSFDDDHRGYWGYGTVVFRDKDGTEYDDIDENELAREIVNEAIDNLLEHDEDYKDVYNITPLETLKVSELSNKELEFTDLSQDIASTLEYIGISDLDNEVGSLYREYCDGEIGEVWYLTSNIPYVNDIARRIR